MYLLGYDIGSSSVKASLVNAESGACVASAFYPKNEAPIKALQTGWAEQAPEDWWQYVKAVTADVLTQSGRCATPSSGATRVRCRMVVRPSMRWGMNGVSATC